MNNPNSINSKPTRRTVLVRCLALALLTGAMLVPPHGTKTVSAQIECRTPSTLLARNVTGAVVTRFGLRTYTVDFRLFSPHATFCDPNGFFLFCNRDKWQYKPDISSNNILSVDGLFDCNSTYNVVLTSTQPNSFVFGFKLRFQQNFFAGFPNGNPKRLTGQLIVSGLAEGQSMDVTDQLSTLADDGTDQ